MFLLEQSLSACSAWREVIVTTLEAAEQEEVMEPREDIHTRALGHKLITERRISQRHTKTERLARSSSIST